MATSGELSMIKKTLPNSERIFLLKTGSLFIRNTIHRWIEKQLMEKIRTEPDPTLFKKFLSIFALKNNGSSH